VQQERHITGVRILIEMIERVVLKKTGAAERAELDIAHAGLMHVHSRFERGMKQSGDTSCLVSIDS
jgi:hypothetical protein